MSRVLLNYTNVVGDDEKETKVPMIAADIAKRLLGLIKAPLHCLETTPFTVSKDLRVRYLKSPAELFGWIAAQTIQVVWAKTDGMLPKPEFLSYLSHVLTVYNAIYHLPHEPPIPGVFYTRVAEPRSFTGKLDELVAMWNPSSDADVAFIKAAVCTPFWGGPPGRRPAIFIENDGTDSGRGVGKSTLMYKIAELAGGHIDCQITEDVGAIKKRILTALGGERVITFDNVKSSKLSSGDIEGMITSPIISGHRMHLGEGKAPNLFTYCFTVNDANMSTDFSQRAVRVRLKRADYTDSWATRIDELVTKHRDEIIGDILWTLRQPAAMATKILRFADWQLGVLARIDARVAEEVAARQEAVDGDKEDGSMIEEIFDMKIRDYRHEVGTSDSAQADPHAHHYFIARSVATAWLREYIDARMTPKAATRMIQGAHIERIGTEPMKLNGNRYWHFRRPRGKDEPLEEWGLNPNGGRHWGYLIKSPKGCYVERHDWDKGASKDKPCKIYDMPHAKKSVSPGA